MRDARMRRVVGAMLIARQIMRGKRRQWFRCVYLVVISYKDNNCTYNKQSHISCVQLSEPRAASRRRTRKECRDATRASSAPASRWRRWHRAQGQEERARGSVRARRVGRAYFFLVAAFFLGAAFFFLVAAFFCGAASAERVR